MKIKGLTRLRPFHRLLEVNVGSRENVAKIIGGTTQIVSRKIKNPYLFTLQDLLRLSGLLKIDFYTLTSIIIENPSFLYAHKKDIEKYYKHLEEEIVTERQSSARISLSVWSLLDVSYKDDSCLKIFDQESL